MFLHILSVRKIIKKLWTELDDILGNVENVTRNRWFNLDDDPDHCLDPGILEGFFLSLHS